MPSGLPAETWVDQTPCAPPVAWPPLLRNAQLTYDTQRGRVVLMSDGINREEVWELDPDTGTWENRTPCELPASWPAPRIGIIGYDQSRGRTVMFGRPDNAASEAMETWEWDGATGTWEMRSVDFPFGGGPDPGEGINGFEYDPQRHTMVLPNFALWEWDGAQATWTQRWNAPLASDVPPAGGPGGRRTQMALGYDPDRSSLFVFGGDSGGYDPILYEYDGTSWTNRAPSPLPANWPTGRVGAAMFYEPTSKRMVVGGGCTVAVCGTDDLWAWDPTAGNWTAAPQAPAAWPQPSQDVISAAGNGRAIILDVFNNVPSSNDPWLGPAALWDLGTGQRSNLRGGHVPVRWPVTPQISAAYDPSRQRIVTFGGESTNASSNGNLVEWNGHDGTWEDRTPNVPPAAWPSPRQQHAMTADSRRGRVLLFGGQFFMYGSAGGSVGPALSDLWEWDGAAGTWTARPAPSGAIWPAPTYGITYALAMVYDEPRDSVLLAGTGQGDPWQWSPTALGWTAPPNSVGFWAAADPMWMSFELPRDRAVLTDGYDAFFMEWDGGTSTLSDLWPGNPFTPGPMVSQVRAVAADPITGLTWVASPTSLWAMDGATATWTDHSVAGALALPWDDSHPPVMVFDESRGTLVLLSLLTDAGGHPLVHVFERAVP